MPRISNTNGRRMVALDLTPREQRRPYEMHGNFSPIDPPHPDLAGWALQVAISAGGDAVGTRLTEWSGFADTHNRLSSRCQSVVWFLTLRPGAVPGPITGYLPEASADCREGRKSGFRPEGGKSISGRAVRTLGCSRPSTGRVPTTPENGLLGSTR